MASRHRLFAPEVVQTSGMDCGPASLKCLLEGFGIPVSYGRLREACQTEVDGTSIDTMEAVANQLGLEAEQILLPLDHVLLFPDKTLPAIVVVRLPSGLTHFVVAWRALGGFLQIMDPATGRRWPFATRFLEEVYVHSMPVPSAAWREFALGEDFQAALKQRLGELGIGRREVDRLTSRASQADSWRSLAALDAATRLIASLVHSGGLRSGNEAARVLDRFSREEHPIPDRYWSARPAARSEDGEEHVLMRGAVLVRALGKKAPQATLGPELAAALNERPTRPARELWGLMRSGGNLAPAVLIPMLALAAGEQLSKQCCFAEYSI